MRTSDDGHWRLAARRRAAGSSTSRVTVRIAVRGDVVELDVENSRRALVFDRRTLAELVLDLSAAGRQLVAADAARTIGAQHKPRGWVRPADDEGGGD